jgi:adenylate kinase family enzyme
MKELFLLRGLPGSGKSTISKQLAGGSGSLHLEAESGYGSSW